MMKNSVLACRLLFAFFSLFAFALHSLAQAPVEDIGGVAGSPAVTTAGSSEPVEEIQLIPVEDGPKNSQPSLAGVGSNGKAEMFYQIQALQQEILELRGQVEKLDHELVTLKKQRLDDYIELDRRITNQSGTASSGPDNSRRPVMPPVKPGPVPTGTGSEKDHYDKAYGLLKQRQVQEAIAAFQLHIETYPEGAYTPNAWYWLGEIYVLQGQLEQAEKHFTHLIEHYPDHRKQADARFKLGKVYFDQGKKQEARKLVEPVAAGDTDVARLAKTWLKTNFPD